jgi:membrane protein
LSSPQPEIASPHAPSTVTTRVTAYVATLPATLRATWTAFNEDKAQRLAASIAYSTIFSLAPLLVLLIAVVGTVLSASGSGGRAGAEDQLLAQIRQSAGPAAANSVRSLIAAAFDKPRANLIAQVLGWVFFAVGASGLFASLQDALNAIWHVESTKGGWRYLVRSRVASFGMIVVVGFLLVVSFVANAAIAFVTAHFLSRIPFAASPLAIQTIGAGLNVLLVAAIFAMLFKILPDVSLSWRDVAIGAVVTAVLFAVGEELIALYITYGGVASAYGAAGSILVALIWIYYSAMILLLGAEFTKVSAKSAALVVASTIRQTSEHPAGADPRTAGRPAS